ncbi:MAG: CPBP family intramembrane metalloprotease [Ignavibacteriae bacterium]|nr:CPBP family intramembrane metalloprotease [Ignavibacteriota bacterium]
MKKTIIDEFLIIKNEFKILDKKVVTIFLSSIFLFTISWYFSTPKFFTQQFQFYKNDFPSNEIYSFMFWFLLDTILFLIIPILIIKYIFKEDLIKYGLTLKNFSIGFKISGISILVFIPIIFLLSQSENFVEYFPLMQSAKDDILIFIIYEIGFIIFIFSWEFIFRGFLLFGLEEKFGIYSIFIQIIPFVILHNGKPFIETFASIFGGIFLGYLALRFRSIWYGFLIHSFILISLDILSFLMN